MTPVPPSGFLNFNAGTPGAGPSIVTESPAGFVGLVTTTGCMLVGPDPAAQLKALVCRISDLLV
jgi:hypothetical protein